MSDSPTENHPEQPSSNEDEGDSVDTTELTEEEQMALYEESLKNSDWGHQPC